VTPPAGSSATTAPRGALPVTVANPGWDTGTALTAGAAGDGVEPPEHPAMKGAASAAIAQHADLTTDVIALFP
jgi:hypothetical protein